MPGMEKLDSFLGLWNSSIYASGNIMEERAEKLYEPEFQKVYRETDSPRNGCVNKTEQWQVSQGYIVRCCLKNK